MSWGSVRNTLHCSSSSRSTTTASPLLHLRYYADTASSRFRQQQRFTTDDFDLGRVRVQLRPPVYEARSILELSPSAESEYLRQADRETHVVADCRAAHRRAAPSDRHPVPFLKSPVVLFIHQSQQQLVCFVFRSFCGRAAGSRVFNFYSRAPRAARRARRLGGSGGGRRKSTESRPPPKESTRIQEGIHENPRQESRDSRRHGEEPQNPRPKSTSEMLASFTVGSAR